MKRIIKAKNYLALSFNDFYVGYTFGIAVICVSFGNQSFPKYWFYVILKNARLKDAQFKNKYSNHSYFTQNHSLK